jgi:FixJ family two-component response regulator
MIDFTIFLVDDDQAVLQALGRLLQAAGYQTKAYSSAKTFLDEHDGSIPGCVVLDLAMPDFNGLGVQDALVRQGMKRPIIFLTGQATIPESVQAMKAGAVDFLTKPTNQFQLLSAIKSAEARDRTQRRVDAQQNAILQKMAKLTRREKEVLDYVVRGYLNKQIGGALGIHEKTIKVHRGRVFKKMDVKTVAELVQMTVRINRDGQTKYLLP